MKDFQTFIFESYEFDQDSSTVLLHYSLDGEENFTETISLPAMEYQRISKFRLERALFTLHLIGGMSYYKTCCPKKIEIRSGELTRKQAEFWNTVYTKGMGEFFYQNQMDPTGLINFPGEAEYEDMDLEREPVHDLVLVPIGGGKDSLVTGELLKAAGHDITYFRVGNHPLISNMISLTGDQSLTIERKLSPRLFELNAEGALNGHVPITAYISCLTVLTALLYGFKSIAFSNERSASEGNTEHEGMEVNHQWSKSVEFESLFRDYLEKYVTQGLDYFSFLRPLSEISIAKELSTHDTLLTAMTSCNKNWKIAEPALEGTRWCNECPKCAFSFALFAAFLPKEKVVEMFGENLFENPALSILYRELFGIAGIKPLECVGEADETKLAFLLAHEKGGLEDTAMMNLFVQEVLPTIPDPQELKSKIFAFSEEHFIPDRYLEALHAHQ